MSRLSSFLSTKCGFHTTFTSQIIVDDSPELTKCTLYLLHILPPRVFVDPYELANYKNFYTFRLWGTSPSELPVIAVPSNGSVLLLNVSLPKHSPCLPQNITLDVPLHIRYGESVQLNTSDVGPMEVPWPIGFWACPSSRTFYHTVSACHDSQLDKASRSSLAPGLPIELVGLLNSSSSTFASVGTWGHTSSEIMQVPVGLLADLKLVEGVTAGVILLVFLYLLRSACMTALRMSARDQHAKVE
jgi:GPI mannosyltransferase 1 subunit X